MTRPTVVAALKEIKTRKRKLMPADVVDAARDESSPLHSKFTWDDTVAAEQYRLWQARELIASVRIYLDRDEERPAPAYVSLLQDRKSPGGGYTPIRSILADKELRKQMVETAVRELKAIQERFDMLAELAGVFREVKKVEDRIVGKRSKSGRLSAA